MNYIILQIIALVVLVLGIGATGVLMMPKKRTETLREDSGMQKKLYLVPLDETSRGLADWMTQQ
ncbi:MAG: hypothetical protein GY855_03475, partial [candidate division Zixibacteria bacterium]|nr:hypothetical protein [candidate division Zixibacteria bacterium]